MNRLASSKEPNRSLTCNLLVRYCKSGSCSRIYVDFQFWNNLFSLQFAQQINSGYGCLQVKFTVVLCGRLSRSAINTSIIASNKQSGYLMSRYAEEAPDPGVDVLDGQYSHGQSEWVVMSDLNCTIESKTQLKEGSEKKQMTCILNAKQNIVSFSAVWWSVPIDHKRSEQHTNYFMSVSTIIFHYYMQVPNKSSMYQSGSSEG